MSPISARTCKSLCISIGPRADCFFSFFSSSSSPPLHLPVLTLITFLTRLARLPPFFGVSSSHLRPEVAIAISPHLVSSIDGVGVGFLVVCHCRGH